MVKLFVKTFLAIVLIGTATRLHAVGVEFAARTSLSLITRVSHENLSKLPVAVTIQTSAQDDGVHFTFTIKEGPKATRFYRGSIQIRKGGELVVECPVEPLTSEGPWKYSFVASKAYLSDSEFELLIGAKSSGVPVPGGHHLLFNLREFQDGVRGNDRQP